MNCPKCGTLCADNQEFCSNCGTKIVSQMSVNSSQMPTNNNFNQPVVGATNQYQNNQVNYVGNMSTVSNANQQTQVYNVAPQQTTNSNTSISNQPYGYTPVGMPNSQQQVNQPAGYTPIGTQMQPQQPNTSNIDPKFAAYQQNANMLQQVNASQPTLNTGMIEREKARTSRENRLMDAFIGRNTDKIRKGGFSFAVFFWGNLYILYRRMWALGIGWSILLLIVGVFLPKYTILQIILNIFMAIKFKDFYVEHVKNKVNEIIESHPNYSDDELAKICYQKGGTSVLNIILFYLAAVIIVGIIGR